jgi:hypothetical protein
LWNSTGSRDSRDRALLVIEIMHVDDIALVDLDSAGRAEEVKTSFEERFQMSDLGELGAYVGRRIERHEDLFYIDQRHYLETIVERFGLEDCKPALTPMEEKLKLAPRLGPDTGSPDTGNPEPGHDINEYRRAIGSLIAAGPTRPDICYAVGVVSRFVSNPSETHWKAVIRIFRYLKGTLDLRLVLGGPCENLSLEVYGDADYGGSSGMKSTSGYLAMLGNGPVQWKSVCQPTVAQSTAEAEYIATAHACTLISATKALLEELGLESLSGKPNEKDLPHDSQAYYRGPFSHTTPLYCDNEACIKAIGDGDVKPSPKHIGIRYFGIREKVANGDIELLPCRTGEMLADGFTKALPYPAHRKFVESLGMLRVEG